nr:PEPxxWA-CTERM sorting domain-containing protein [Polymorphobacter sp.]
MAAPASATSFAWTQGSDGDIWSQSITPEYANTISFSGEDSSYGTGLFGPMAHSHSQALTWSIILNINGVDQTVFSQFFAGDDQTALNSLGVISFAGGTVSSVGFSCDNCSFNTFHQFSDTRIELGTGAVPEPASWAMMIAGFGLVGAAARRRRGQFAATAG